MKNEIKKIALDAETHLHLLTSLLDIIGRIDPSDKGLDAAVEKLLDEVRHSDIIESYELMEDEVGDEI